MIVLPRLGSAEITRALVYPDVVDGLAAMQQVYFVNRHFAFDNIQVGSRSQPVRMILKQENSISSGNTLVRSLNNRPSKDTISFQDKVYFPSGKVKGTAILVVGYRDKAASYSIWLPALRKVRRIAEPAHDDRWGGSPLTYGDIYFRKPSHERHELLATESFASCLDALDLDDSDIARIRQQPPARSCYPQGRTIYRVKSSTTFDNWWYDYRIVSIDKESFADYRSDYFKDDKLVKRIDKDWRPLAGHDPRAVLWHYWFAEDYVTGQRAIGYLELEGVQWNQEVDPRQWSERALRKIKR